jgi:hypothetical protein
MKPTASLDRKPDWKSKLLERLHDPLQLRVCVAGAALLVGYFAVCTPLGGDIVETTRQLAAERKMVDLASMVEELRAQYARFRDRLPAGADANEWVEHVLNGMRTFPLRLVSMDCGAPRDMGPYKAVVLQIEVEGGFFALDGFLRWLESNSRLLRADAIRIAPSRSNANVLVMQITVLGVMSCSSMSLGKMAPTVLAVGMIGYWAWPFVSPAEGEAKKDASVPQIAPATLAPKIMTPPQRDPFGEPGRSKGATQPSAGGTAKAAAAGGTDILPAGKGRTGETPAPPGTDAKRPTDWLSTLTLSATCTAGGRPTAIINGRLYSQGETLKLAGAPVSVAEIRPYGVVLESQGKKSELAYADVDRGPRPSRQSKPPASSPPRNAAKPPAAAKSPAASAAKPSGAAWGKSSR